MLQHIKSVAAIVIIGISALASSAANASVTYTYTGNPFNYFNGGSGGYSGTKITGSFTVATALASNQFFSQLAPISFSFTDGYSTITNTTQGLLPSTPFEISTNQLGNISQWNIMPFVSGPNNSVVSVSTCSGSCNSSFYTALDFGEIQSLTVNGSAGSQNNPGIWNVTVSSPVPEPHSSALLGFGLLGLGFVVRKRA